MVAKYLLLFMFVSFTSYTIWCSYKESLIKSAKKIFQFRWGRQVTIDLYIGLFIFHFFVFLVEGEVLKTVFWLIPSLILGNIVPLIYLIWNYEELLARSVF